MPKLSRFRLVSIGHPNARMQDLVLDFRDQGGDATDSTIWLRNGGGKSSILNLFFAMLRTGRREFLGGRADSKQRRLEDYVLTNDRSVVVAEWVLDFEANELAFEGMERRFLTGVYYERLSGKEGIRRLFFSTRVNEQVIESTFQGIPIDTENSDGQRVRRTLGSFRQALHELRDKYPSLQCFCTEVQSDWRDRLQSAGLDPGLFSYQLQMNLREGGADELFRFSNAEDFIDFLLELTVEPSKSESISENMQTFRKQLQQRKHELIPDLELSTGLIERLTPLVEIGDRRKKSMAEGLRLRGSYDQILCSLSEHRKRLESESDDLERRNSSLQREIEQLEREAHRYKGMAAALDFEEGKQKFLESELNLNEVREKLSEAHREMILWRAAVPLWESMVSQQEAEAYRLQFSGNDSQRAPLMERVKEVAQRYAGALKAQAMKLRERQQDIKERYREEDQRSRDLSSEVSFRERQISGLESEISSLGLNLKKRNEQLSKFIASGSIKEGESSVEALGRVRSEIEGIHQQLKTLDVSQESNSASSDELERRYQEFWARISEKRAILKQAKSEYDKALESKEKLESDKVLLRCFEVDRLDLDDMPLDSVHQLHRRATEQQERVSRLRMELASTERARLYLQEHSLLAPTAEVSALLEALSPRFSVKSGWAYLSEDYAESLEERNLLVRNASELAMGIVVSAKDFESVRRYVESKAELLPDLPVILSTPEAFEEAKFGGVAHRVVLGPKSQALYDKASGQEALAEMEKNFDVLEERIASAQRLHAEFSDISMRFKHFRSLYGKGWFSEQRSLMSQIGVEIEDLQAQLSLIDEERSRFLMEKREHEEKRRLLGSRLSDLMMLRERLENFKEDLESNREHWEHEIELKRARVEQLKDEVFQIGEHAEASREEARRILMGNESVAEEARLMESQLPLIRYIKVSEIEPVQGAIDLLRKEYERLLEQVDREIGSDELLRMAEVNANQSQKYLKEAQKVAKGKVSIEEVKQALESSQNLNDIEAERERTEELWSICGTAEKEAQKIYDLSRIALEQKEKHWLGLGKPSLSEDAKSGSVAKFSEMSDWQLKLVETHRSEYRENEVGIQAKTQQIMGLDKDLERLGSVYRSYAELLGEGSEQVQSDEIELLDLKVISSTISVLESGLGSLSESMDKLDERRKEAVSVIYKWVDEERFGALNHRLVSQFRSLEPDSLESSASEYREELGVRVREISQTLSDIEKHRNLLGKLVLNAAEEGLRLLKLADRASQLPLDVPSVGGSQFLRISTKEPIAPDERLSLIMELVDGMIDEDIMPSGILLVQRAVRHLARPFRVRVLNPDSGSPQRYIEITETSRFSGGEQLTCAILLYCTLANVRARTRGMNRQPTSVLVLDNPIGRASRTMFIDMQRQFARAMGIQLIYTTAVNDLEALSMLPNIIRLRNERVDRNKGHRLLETDEITGELNSLRVGF